MARHYKLTTQTMQNVHGRNQKNFLGVQFRIVVVNPSCNG